ncbi:MAG: MMPL family transporter [Myxococcota bacterium]
MSRRARLTAWAALCIALFVYSARHVTFTADITNFMPDGRGAELAQISRALIHSDLARTMVLTIGADDPARAVAAAKALAEALRAHPEVAWLRSGADPELQEQVYRLYFPRRHYFVSDDPERELAARLSPDGLRAEAQALRRSLSLPISPLLTRIAPEDPLGVFPALLERMRAGEPPLATRDGVFTTRDGAWAVILLATRHSAFDTVAQTPLLDEIRARFEETRARLGPDLVLEQSGANRFALDAETRLREDASLISTLSTLGVAVLSWLFFRSFLSLGLAMVPALVGLLIAMAAGLAIFGRLDGTTIGFGASLIGVTIDYPTHFLILRSLSARGESPWQLARRLSGSLSMAALTTMASFAGLAITSFRGFRELGVFSGIGVAGALFATLFLMPDLVPRRRGMRPVSARLARRFDGWIPWLRRHRSLLAGVPIAVLALGAFALPRLHWNDDLSQLGQPDPRLRDEEARVRARVSNFDGGRFVVTLADDPESAVARNDAVYARLEPLLARGELGGLRSLHDLVWSRDLQRRNLELLRASPDLEARLDASFREAGFRPGSFAPFARALDAPPEPLTLAELRASPLAPLASTLVLELEGRTAVITYLREVRDPEAIRAALADLPDAHLVDQRVVLNEVAQEFRTRTLLQIVIGSVCVGAILIARYRDWRRAFAAFLPALLTALIVLSAFALTGTETNLLHAVSLLIVMGMGVDYGIFVVDSVDQPDELGATLVSCLLCCLTTLLGFGALALSSHPALRAIGITTGFGVALSLVLAPLTLLALRADATRAAPGA